MDTKAPQRATQSLPHLAKLAAVAGKPIFIFDLEATTGDLKDPQFGIVEIGWVRAFADGRLEEGALLIDAKQPMNPYAAKLTGITRKLYAGQPDFHARWPLIEPMMTQSLCSGFGIHDLDCKAVFKSAEAFLGEEGGRRPLIDSLDARDLWTRHTGSPKGQLGEVAKNFGHQEPATHRALSDARAAAAALNGLVGQIGAQACHRQSRIQWNPLIAIDKAVELALANEATLASALAKTLGLGSFHAGLENLDAMGIRAHHAVKGFSWWRGNHRVKLEGAPQSAAELCAHFGCPLPTGMDVPDTLTRCEAFLTSEPGAGADDEKIALSCLCRAAGSAAAARAKAIRRGALAPWTGVAQGMKDFATAASATLACRDDERSILEGLRACAPQDFRASDALSSAAASLARELGCPPPKPKAPRP